MFPRVRQPAQVFIKPTPKPNTPLIKEPRKTWHPDSQILSVQPPRKILVQGQTKTKNRKYASIRFKYKDGLTKQVKVKSIMFGDLDGQFVGDKDVNKRRDRFKRFGHKDDPFHPNYWRLKILNTEQTMEDAYVLFQRQLMNLRMQAPQPMVMIRNQTSKPANQLKIVESYIK